MVPGRLEGTLAKPPMDLTSQTPSGPAPDPPRDPPKDPVADPPSRKTPPGGGEDPPRPPEPPDTPGEMIPPSGKDPDPELDPSRDPPSNPPGGSADPNPARSNSDRTGEFAEKVNGLLPAAGLPPPNPDPTPDPNPAPSGRPEFDPDGSGVERSGVQPRQVGLLSQPFASDPPQETSCVRKAITSAGSRRVNRASVGFTCENTQIGGLGSKMQGLLLFPGVLIWTAVSFLTRLFPC